MEDVWTTQHDVILRLWLIFRFQSTEFIYSNPVTSFYFGLLNGIMTRHILSWYVMTCHGMPWQEHECEFRTVAWSIQSWSLSKQLRPLSHSHHGVWGVLIPEREVKKHWFFKADRMEMLLKLVLSCHEHQKDIGFSRRRTPKCCWHWCFLVMNM